MTRTKSGEASNQKPSVVGAEVYIAVIVLSTVAAVILWTSNAIAGPFRYVPLVGILAGTVWWFWQAAVLRQAQSVFAPPPSNAVRFFPEAGSEKWTFEGSTLDNKLSTPSVSRPVYEGLNVTGPSREVPFDALIDSVVCAASFHAATAAAAPVFTTLARLSDDFGRAVALDPETAGHLSEAAQQGYLNWLEGHTGETIAAEALQNLGHHVEFAETANQTGWDLMVDGTPYNVKVGETASQLIRDHFAQHPDIGVITHVDAAEHFPVDHVIGLKELTVDHIDGAIDAAEHLDTASGIAEAAIHFPIATTAVSIWREFGIAKRHGFEPTEAIATVAEKSAWVLGGTGLAVTIAGANHWNPLGWAIAGGLLARWVWKEGQSVKAEEQRKCLSDYFETWQRVWDAGSKDLAVSLEVMVQNHQTSFERELADGHQVASTRSKELRRELFEALARLCHECLSLFQRMDDDLAEDLRRVDVVFPRRSTFLRTICPRISDYLGDLARSWITAKREELTEESEASQEIFAEAELAGPSIASYASLSQRLSHISHRYEISDEVLARQSGLFIATAKEIARSADRLLQELLKEVEPIRQRYLALIDRATADIWSLKRGIFIALVDDAERNWHSTARAVERAGQRIGNPTTPFRDFISGFDKGASSDEEKSYSAASSRVNQRRPRSNKPVFQI